MKGNTGRVCWSHQTIRGMLENEKYKGDSLFQKTYTVDYLTHKTRKNTGQVDQYYVKGSHPAIIDEETWDAVQLEIERRRRFIKEHDLAQYGYCNGSNCPYISHVFCGECGSVYFRQKWQKKDLKIWYYKRYLKKNGRICINRAIDEKVIDRAMVIAWNSIVENRDKYLAGWEKACVEGNPLEKVRAKQMIELTAEGKIKKQVPELTQMALEGIIVNRNTLEIRFLDGIHKSIVV